MIFSRAAGSWGKYEKPSLMDLFRDLAGYQIMSECGYESAILKGKGGSPSSQVGSV